MKPQSLRLFDIPDADPGPLSSYDWIVVSSSAGKDSMATLIEMHDRCAAAGVADRLVAVHACLGRVEWPGTRDLAERQAQSLGVPFYVVSARVGLLERTEKRRKWPDPARRWCTSDLKRGPIHTLYTRLGNTTRSREGAGYRVRILSCIGLRAEESSARAKRSPLQVNRNASNGRREVVDYLPIHRWEEAAVWERIRLSPLSGMIHPAYQFVGRLSCSFCIFAPRDALIAAGHQRPDLLAEYVETEKKIGHRFRLDLSMADVAAACAAGESGRRVSTWTM